jgi:pimeloyl-ACP methyl ester carboxylesterase
MKIKVIAAVISLALATTAFANSPINKDSYTDNGQGKTIVLIHAFPADHHLWDMQIKTLSQKYRVITLDLKGFGQATPTDGKTVSMREYAAQVKQLLDQLHVKTAVIGGESMGGYISLAFLKAYPDKTEGLILSNTQAKTDSAEENVADKKDAADILVNGTNRLVADFVPKALSSNASHEAKELVTDMFANQKATGVASALRGMATREDTTKTLAATSIPVLIISSNLDEVISPKESMKMSKIAKNSKLIMIKDAGHLTNIERPDVWNKAVENYFK